MTFCGWALSCLADGQNSLFSDQTPGSPSRDGFERVQRCCNRPFNKSRLSGRTAGARLLSTWSVASLCCEPARLSQNARKMVSAMPLALGGNPVSPAEASTSSASSPAAASSLCAFGGRLAGACGAANRSRAETTRSWRRRSPSTEFGSGGGTPATPSLPVQVSVPGAWPAQSWMDPIIARSMRFNSGCWACTSSFRNSPPSRSGRNGRTNAKKSLVSCVGTEPSAGSGLARQRIPWLVMLRSAEAQPAAIALVATLQLPGLAPALVAAASIGRASCSRKTGRLPREPGRQKSTRDQSSSMCSSTGVRDTTKRCGVVKRLAANVKSALGLRRLRPSSSTIRISVLAANWPCAERRAS
mmetsp:Transcript_11418/g.34464  ORF Transcript_11418/g.34464 Transcript_11418/m.34464 type:complete len:357 (+) Transcript_11418:128-1198(+)